MHEMSLCESVLDILQTESKRQNFTKVKIVRLDIGVLSHVEPEAMEFCFSAVTKGTLADAAKLVILRSPGAAWCMDCNKEVEIEARFDPCPHCGGHKLQVTGGEELKIHDLEVE